MDRFTLGHAAFGVLLALGRVPPAAAVVLAVGWELIEDPLKDALPAVFPDSTGDSAANAVVDALAVLGGYAATRLAFPLEERRP